MTTTPRGAPELAAGQAVPETTVNEAVRFTEAGASLFVVADNDLTAPPGSCADGASYIIAATATGAWTGKEKQIATAVGTNAASGWLYHAPAEGYFAYIQDENVLHVYDGSAWGAFAAAGGVSDLDDLADVNAPTPADGDVLTWDSGGSAWVSQAPGSGGAGAWSLVASRAMSGQTNEDFTGLGSYHDLILIAEGVTQNAMGYLSIRFSTDNGSTFYSTSGNYKTVTGSGDKSATGDTEIRIIDNTASAARTGIAEMFALNVNGGSKLVKMENAQGRKALFLGSTSPVNAVRLFSTSGNTLPAGTVYLFGRS